ncbi:MAG: CDC27 family protein [Candidatus Omnitrophota bacterium]
MKILHGPTEVASLMRTHAEAQRLFGHEAITAEVVVGPQKDGDIRLFNRNPGKGVKREENRNKLLQQFVNEHLFAYDVYHFYYNTTFFADHADLEMLRRAGKVIVMQLCGGDSQNREPGCSLFDHFRRVYHGKQPVMPPMMTPSQHQRMAFIDRYVHAFITGSGRIDHVPRLALMPRTNRSWVNPVDIKQWKEKIQSVDLSNKDPNKVYILHAPTLWQTKGSDFILPVLDRLQQRGYPVESILIQGVLPSKVHEYYAKADIVVEQILSGWYSTFACEMMAAGKPVVCRIDPYLQSHLGLNPPLVHADPYTLFDVLVSLIENPERRKRIGEQEQEFAEEYHDHIKIGKDLLDVYDLLLHDRPIVQIPNPAFYTDNKEQNIQPFWPTPLPEHPTYEEMILKRRVNDFDKNLALARFYESMDNMRQAVPFLEKCVELQPDYFEGIRKLALYHLNGFRYWKAKPWLRRCLELRQESLPSLLNLAQQRVKEERYHDALTILEILAECNPSNLQYRFLTGQIYHNIDEYERAEAAYEEILQIDAANLQTLTQLRILYLHQGKTAKAEDIFQRMQTAKETKA